MHLYMYVCVFVYLHVYKCTCMMDYRGLSENWFLFVEI